MTDDDDNRSLNALRKQVSDDEPGAVEFALMLDRAIEAFRNDPELMRSAVYELARTKLRDQLEGSGAGHSGAVLEQLEVAIGKVEAFSKSQPALLFRPQDLGGPATPPALTTIPSSGFARSTIRSRRWAGYMLAVLIAGGALVAILAGRMFFHQAASSTPPAPETPAVVAAPAPPAEKKRPMPSTYGAFAIVDGNFVELHPVGINAPDIRVAVSPQIKLPDRSVLDTANPTFMIYERFPPAVARAEARAMARISRVHGDQTATPDSAWIIRNIATPLRVVMDPDRSDVLMISPNADVALKPGRYALVVGTKTFDFTIAGKPDPAVHCLEQVAATNGTFYAPCK